MKTNVRRRLYLVAGMAALALSPLAPGVATSDAHTCAQVRVYLNGSTTPVGSCHDAPCPDGHHGAGFDSEPFGTGAGMTLCVTEPIAAQL